MRDEKVSVKDDEKFVHKHYRVAIDIIMHCLKNDKHNRDFIFLLTTPENCDSSGFYNFSSLSEDKLAEAFSYLLKNYVDKMRGELKLDELDNDILGKIADHILGLQKIESDKKTKH